jgi:hypothetical protein
MIAIANLSGVNYVNYGRFDGYDENGQATASFTKRNSTFFGVL